MVRIAIPLPVRLAIVVLVLLGTSRLATSGTWSDNFSQDLLGSDWRGDRDDFSIMDGALKGHSVSPLAPSPFNLVEVGTNWADGIVQCRINVVSPNLAVCTKGALILRHTGNEGYVFALHTAVEAIEVYRLSTHEMLLSQKAPLEMRKWYDLRAELNGSAMSFFVDDQLIGTVQDDRSLEGAMGVAAQDASEVLFDDFTVTGPNIPSNRLEAVRLGESITFAWPAALTNYVLKVTPALSAAARWETITNTPKADGDRLTLTLDIGSGDRFYLLTPQ